MSKRRPTDDEVVARVCATIVHKKLLVRHNSWGVIPLRIDPKAGIPQGPFCAVGAGVFWRSLTELRRIVKKGRVNKYFPVELFARAHGVPFSFAEGVSVGYESYSIHDTYSEITDYEEFERGVGVGETIRAFVEDTDEA